MTKFKDIMVGFESRISGKRLCDRGEGIYDATEFFSHETNKRLFAAIIETELTLYDLNGLARKINVGRQFTGVSSRKLQAAIKKMEREEDDKGQK